MTKTFLLIFPLFFTCLDCNAQDIKKNTPSIGIIYNLKVIGDNVAGWGYQIYRNEKMMINQKIIPAVSGNKRFETETDARRVGELVLKKLSMYNDLPSVTISELDSLKIKH